jgi:hypothetical protein
MKAFRLMLVVMAAALVTFGLGGSALAFHDGGVAHCDGCHGMHGTDGSGGAVPIASDRLLLGSDASSTCLNCHEGTGSYHIASGNTTTVSYNAGGDFAWLKKDYQIDKGWATIDVDGQTVGHNVIAVDYGYDEDSVLATAPGGTYPAEDLGCTSCHDAHGAVLGGTGLGNLPVSESGSYGAAVPASGSILGNYRLLGDSQYDAGDADTDGYNFGTDAPIATAQNGSFGGYYSEKVDYGTGMSEWCRNCHTDFHDGGAVDMHPAGDGESLGALSTNYNSYVATGNFTGVEASAYDALVSIERGVAVGADLDPDSTAGDGGSANVMCLTCHRAHASAFQNMARWDFETEYLAHSYPTQAEHGLTDPNAAYYKNGVSIDIVATYGEYQRSLCNKCHVQD